MEHHKMHQMLSELRAELASDEQLERYQAQKLEALADRIHSIVESKESRMSGDEYLLAKLKEAAEEFEIKHPAVTDILGRMSDLLARMGI